MSDEHPVALARTGVIRGTSTNKLFNKLGLKTLEKRRWCRKLCCTGNSYKSHSPKNAFLTFFPLL